MPMCGIVGYVGDNESRSLICRGLQRLEYRGYDSAGFACLDSRTQQISYKKTTGQLKNLLYALEIDPIDGSIGIGHTRWATHGSITQENAHPQMDCHGKCTIVHNGIIENFQELKSKLLQQNHSFQSQTDTEIIAHLCEAISKDQLIINISEIVNQLHGAFAFILLHTQLADTLVAVRKGSPLCIGIGKNLNFIASDPLAFAGSTEKVLFLPDESFAIITKDEVRLYNFAGIELNLSIEKLDIVWSEDEKSGYEHYMLKEIYEQKKAINQTLSWYKEIDETIWQHINITPEQIKQLRSLHLIGCGTSWHAGRIGQFFFEHIAHIPTRVVLASEFRYAPLFPEDNSIYLALSQSGETADTLECIRLINSYNLPTVALTNMASSTMVREVNGALLTKAGQEIAVASTKAFSTQLVVLYWLAHRIAQEKGIISSDRMQQTYDDLALTAEVLENSIERYRISIEKKLAPFYAKFKRFIFLGRQESYPFALESALKLKEISYIFAQCYPAGELKHGPIALLDAQTPVVLFSSLDKQIYHKIISNGQEVKARGAHLVAFAFEGQVELANLADHAFVLPRVNPLLAPLAMTGLMQFWVYHIARVLNCPIDKPRNLAKSVTVE
jgi:glutamine---fructose-6-phosphate transaminase (isomerizing)